MRLLLSGDPHVKISTIEVGRRFLAFLSETIRIHQPDLVVVLGDLFDTHSVLRVEVLNAWINFLKEIDSPDFQWEGHAVLMTGNHDKAGPSGSEHALVALDRFHSVTIVDAPRFMDAAGKARELRGMTFLPYYHTYQEFSEALQTYPPDRDNQFLFCHNTFDGAQYENGFYDPNGFPLESVAGFKTVISGHIHRAQQLANVTYVGSPYDAGFQDAGEIKGLHLFDTETGVFQRIRTPLPHYHVLRFETPDGFLENFETFSPSPEDHFKVLVKGDRAGIAMLATDERFRRLKASYKLSLAPEFTVEVPRQGALLQKAATLEGMVETYVSEVMDTSLDKARLIEYARAALNG